MLDLGKSYYIFFNGDADGICSALQFLLSTYNVKAAYTGVKRDQNLLRYGVSLKQENILVFDIELEKAKDSLKQVLDNKCSVTWFDHHGNNKEKDFCHYLNFHAFINNSKDTNTSLIVNKFLNKPELLKWAIVGLFGDNIDDIALHYVKELNLSHEELCILSSLGKLINYNSYGQKLEDLIIDPLNILNTAKSYIDPIVFYYNTGIIHKLKKHSTEDFHLALSCYKGENIVFLPNASWSFRVYGILGNYLANTYKQNAFAILVEIDDSNFLVSVRAPLCTAVGAGNLCRKFATGGGRERAGGINKLNKDSLEQFIQAFKVNWSK